ncbi:ras-related protein rab-21-like protein [Conidiobolus coronatus NRRL 28638]|uniref:Ras-related protein rab-21-like protein n=1 Tax=Conidiobolus coronatus (strain ATCC 28846 / CBS 209.66 / NRRL 28638) TaxID=796925 RepID=A0A137PHE8_CONC2|nr:ras-related protein rab-21-like protein [Conidiobolus coronatus NRRL 28638]|eukprot:KXN74418.1 ras-related protein rab-21-like protein [Conidiobolus coronatus NRRL 28638]
MQPSLLEAKVVILGSQGVGKSSLVVRYVQKTFSPNCPSTIGASFSTTKITVDNCKVRLQIWDTAGQERFRSMAPMYYRGANAAILVYDITNSESFQDMHRWLEELKKNMTEDLVIHIVGSKSDLENQRQVQPEQVREYVNSLDADYITHEVSAKDDHGIDELFLQISQQLVQRKSGIEQSRKNKANGRVVVKNDIGQTSSGSGCC